MKIHHHNSHFASCAEKNCAQAASILSLPKRRAPRHAASSSAHPFARRPAEFLTRSFVGPEKTRQIPAFVFFRLYFSMSAKQLNPKR